MKCSVLDLGIEIRGEDQRSLHHGGFAAATGTVLSGDCVFFVTVMSPVVVCGVNFPVYVLKDRGDKTLAAFMIFMVVCLFWVLRLPINYAGKLMGKAAQGLQVCQRFANFFAREIVLQALLEEMVVCEEDSDGDDEVLSVTNVKFLIASTLETDTDTYFPCDAEETTE